ncbi:conserved hypothetical protein [Ixodes scapularis]|uniref:UNC93-like protein MFSD11 n=1 Tax=Ixodes scapularis TaxID=6945 RepID=B7QLX7_IXOSC|nr:conserved hypothetical protein [Ixodes scapularis]|eukprot:XP_002416182.1 conserved hypothetical protein [Ixodes scapularis]
MNVKMFNVILLGFGFMFVFTAFQTGGLIQKIILDSIQAEDPTYTGDGYVSLAVIYAVFAISNWISPSIITFLGPKYTMFVGAVTYKACIWALCVINAGHQMMQFSFARAVIWTGQGNFLTINSNSTTMSRNSGVFWAMLQCSLIWGNIFVYVQFQGLEHIDKATRTTVFGALTGVGILGMLLILILRGGGLPSRLSTRVCSYCVHFLLSLFTVKSLRLGKTRKMLTLSASFFYTGLELSFFSGVYGACLGFTKSFGKDSSKFLGINGLLIGAGEITGGLAFSILGKQTNKAGRDPIVLLGFLVHIVAYYTIFINLPANSNLAATWDRAYIESNLYLAFVGSFLLGLGDSCFNTQLYSLLGFVYSEDSAPAFAIFKFVQAVAAAVAFFYSNYLLLPYQLLILVVCATLGTLSFWLVEWETYVEHKASRPDRSNESSTSSSAASPQEQPHVEKL